MQRRNIPPPGTPRAPKRAAETRTPRERYAEAAAVLSAAEERVRALAGQLTELGQSLTESPLTTAPSQAPSQSAGPPLHIMTHPFRREISMAEWPDAGSIVSALGELHAARSRVLALRAWMLPQDRAATPEPSDSPHQG